MTLVATIEFHLQFIGVQRTHASNTISKTMPSISSPQAANQLAQHANQLAQHCGKKSDGCKRQVNEQGLTQLSSGVALALQLLSPMLSSSKIKQ